MIWLEMLANDQSLPIEKFNRSRNFRLFFRTKERELKTTDKR